MNCCEPGVGGGAGGAWQRRSQWRGGAGREWQRQRAALTSDVDLFHCLAVLRLHLHLNGGPKEHVFALQAVLATGCRQPLVV